MPGICLWYVAEMLTRAEYYRRLLSERANLRVHRVDVDSLTTAEGAAAFLRVLSLAPEGADPPELPPKTNATRSWPLGEAMKAKVRRMVDAFPFDPAILAEQFIASGRRLA